MAAYPISDLDRISPGISRLLVGVKIRTTVRLLARAKDARGRKALSSELGVSEKDILRCANMADRMRVRGVGRDNAILLEAAGVDTVRELRYRNPGNLATAMADVNRKRKLVRQLPSEKVIEGWIESARKLKTEISY
jgi:hypothetical protein